VYVATTSEVIAVRAPERDADVTEETSDMTSNRILQINATATAVTGAAMLAARGFLPPLFGLGSPILLDLIAIFFLAYAAALFFVAARPQVERAALLAFAAADGAWVVGSVVVLLLFWSQLTPIARVLIVAVGIVVDTFAMLQYRAAKA
jgi:hypothetical protein